MLILPATITSREARDTQRMLAQALKQEVNAPGQAAGDPGITVDASGLRQFDSSALAVLLECQRLAQAWGKGFVVRDAPPKLAALARLYEVEALLMPGQADEPVAGDTLPAG